MALHLKFNTMIGRDGVGESQRQKYIVSNKTLWQQVFRIVGYSLHKGSFSQP